MGNRVRYEAGERDEAVAITSNVCLQLETWGAWGREERLLRETLAWVPENSQSAAAFRHHLGILAQYLGAYEEALDWYHQSLAIKEALGDRAGMARSYHELGRVAQARGAYEEALDWYRQSLAIKDGPVRSGGDGEVLWYAGCCAHRNRKT